MRSQALQSRAVFPAVVFLLIPLVHLYIRLLSHVLPISFSLTVRRTELKIRGCWGSGGMGTQQ